MSTLGDDTLDPIITIATSYLPGYEVHDLRLVCKKFKELIDDYKIITCPRLIKDHPVLAKKKRVHRFTYKNNKYYIAGNDKEITIYDEYVNKVSHKLKIDHNESGSSRVYMSHFTLSMRCSGYNFSHLYDESSSPSLLYSGSDGVLFKILGGTGGDKIKVFETKEFFKQNNAQIIDVGLSKLTTAIPNSKYNIPILLCFTDDVIPFMIMLDKLIKGPQYSVYIERL